MSDVSLLDRVRGETFGLVGESGCGKTTLGRLITALEAPDSGVGPAGGHRDVSKLRGGALRRYRRDLQLMFQDPYSSLDPRMRVLSILREPLAIQGIGSHTEQRQRVYELLDEVGLPRNAVAGAVPARVLRRPAPAHRPGQGADPRAGAHRRRRAGLGA